MVSISNSRPTNAVRSATENRDTCRAGRESSLNLATAGASVELGIRDSVLRRIIISLTSVLRQRGDLQRSGGERQRKAQRRDVLGAFHRRYATHRRVRTR